MARRPTDRQVKVWCSPEELEELKKVAASYGLSASNLIKLAVNTLVPRVAPFEIRGNGSSLGGFAKARKMRELKAQTTTKSPWEEPGYFENKRL